MKCFVAPKKTLDHMDNGIMQYFYNDTIRVFAEYKNDLPISVAFHNPYGRPNPPGNVSFCNYVKTRAWNWLYIERKWVIILAWFLRWLSSLIPTGGMYFKIRVVYQICGLEIQQWPNIACHRYLMKWRVILFGNVACPFIEYTATSYFMMLWTWLDVASHLWCKKQLHLRMCYNYLCRL